MRYFFKDLSAVRTFFSTNSFKTRFSVALGLLMIAIGYRFIRDKGVQFFQIKDTLVQADHNWLWLGIGLSFLYVWLHAEMYRQSFKTIGLEVTFQSMMRLYVKRNAMSVLLPAGFIASQTFFSKEVSRMENVKEEDVWCASGIFSVALLISNVITVLPALGWIVTENILPGGAAEAFFVVSLFFFALIYGVFSFLKQGAAYRWSKRRLPALTNRFEHLEWSQFRMRYLVTATLISCLVMAVGIIHIFIATRTLGATATLPMCFAGYIAILIVLLTAPFLRGAGAVEAVLAMVLMHFGLTSVEAVAVAVLFRFYEFWLVLVFALPAFVTKPFAVRQWMSFKRS